MTVFHCARFPDGEAPIRTTAGLVYFVNGRAEIHDRLELIAALREVPAVFGITEEAAETHPSVASRPPAKPRRPTRAEEQ